MNQSNQVAVWAVAAIVVGVVLALVVPGQESGTESAVPTKKPAPTREQRQARLTAPTEIEEDTPANDYLEARWGHLGDAGSVTAHVDPMGNRYFVDKRIFVGRGRGGQPLFARAFAKAEPLHPEAIKATAAGLEGARVSLAGWEPGPMSKLYKNIKHANEPDDLPEDLQHLHPKHPDYEGPTGN